MKSVFSWLHSEVKSVIVHKAWIPITYQELSLMSLIQIIAEFFRLTNSNALQNGKGEGNPTTTKKKHPSFLTLCCHITSKFRIYLLPKVRAAFTVCDEYTGILQFLTEADLRGAGNQTSQHSKETETKQNP